MLAGGIHQSRLARCGVSMMDEPLCRPAPLTVDRLLSDQQRMRLQAFVRRLTMFAPMGALIAVEASASSACQRPSSDARRHGRR
jgi:hypothetical protein